MITPCLLAVQQDSLIGKAMASILLRENSDLKMVTFHAKDLKGLIEETTELKPNVFILGESTPLAEQDILGPLLMSFPELKIILVSEGTNWLHIINKKDKLVTSQNDLLDVLC
jgi:hypothetical protein